MNSSFLTKDLALLIDTMKIEAQRRGQRADTSVSRPRRLPVAKAQKKLGVFAGQLLQAGEPVQRTALSLREAKK